MSVLGRLLWLSWLLTPSPLAFSVSQIFMLPVRLWAELVKLSTFPALNVNTGRVWWVRVCAWAWTYTHSSQHSGHGRGGVCRVRRRPSLILRPVVRAYLHSRQYRAPLARQHLRSV